MCVRLASAPHRSLYLAALAEPRRKYDAPQESLRVRPLTRQVELRRRRSPVLEDENSELGRAGFESETRTLVNLVSFVATHGGVDGPGDGRSHTTNTSEIQRVSEGEGVPRNEAGSPLLK